MNRPVIAGVLIGLGIVGSGTLVVETLLLSTSTGSIPQTDRPSSRLASPGEAAGQREEFGELAAVGARGLPRPEMQAPPLFEAPDLGGADDAPGEGSGGRAAPSEQRDPLSTETTRAIQQRLLEAARSPGTTSASDVADALAELREELGDRDVGGHRLSELEEITRTAARTQALTEDIKALVANPTPENRRRLGELIQRAQRLSAELTAQMGLSDDGERVPPEAVVQRPPQMPLLPMPQPAERP